MNEARPPTEKPAVPVDSGGAPEEHASAALDVNLRVLPSVQVQRLHSVDQNCQGTPHSTISLPCLWKPCR